MKTKNFQIKDRIAVSSIKPNEGKNVNSFAVLLPGFLDSKDYSHLKRLSNKLADRGVASLRFDPTGTWSSADGIKDYTISQYKKDLNDVINFLEKNKDPKNIILIGHSIGAMLSIIGGKDKRVDSIIAIMPSPSFTEAEAIQEKLPKWKEKGVKVSRRDKPGKNEKVEIKVPYSFVEDALNYDAREVVSQYNKPLLLIAGEEDNSVTIDSVESIYKVANSPKEFRVLEGIGHDYRIHNKQVSRVNNKIINFLNETGLL